MAEGRQKGGLSTLEVEAEEGGGGGGGGRNVRREVMRWTCRVGLEEEG